MKKIISILTCLLFLTSCGGNSGQITKTDDRVVKKWDTILVDYVGKLEDGTIFDTSIKEFAKQTKNYSEQREYKPLEFTVWEGKMIPWFDKGVEWMKIWEKKTLKIIPSEGYGEKTVKTTTSKKYFDKMLKETIPAESFQDYIEKEVPKSALSNYLSWQELKEWAKLNLGNDIVATIKKVNWDQATVSMENKTNNPFFWKKLKVWLEWEYSWNKIKITAMGADESTKESTVTVEMENTQNPFYGKELKAGLEWKDKNGKPIKIISIEGDNVVLEMENTHELAWKTLIFDVELKNIKTGSGTENKVSTETTGK